MSIDENRALMNRERVFSEAPIGLCCFDTELRYVHVNQWLAVINGLSVDKHLGRTVREVFPNLAAGIEWQLRQVIETGEPILDGTVEAETLAQPGTKRVFQHNYSPLKADDGTVLGVSCVVNEITERKRAKEDFRKRLDADLLRVQRLLEQIRQDIGHRTKQGADIAARLATLTNREHEVMDLLVEAKQAKQIALKLGIKPKTVEHHRSKILKKMHVESAVELMRLVLSFGTTEEQVNATT